MLPTSKYKSVNDILNGMENCYEEQNAQAILQTLESCLDKYDPEDRYMDNRNGIMHTYGTGRSVALTVSCLFWLLSKHYDLKENVDVTIDKVYNYFQTYAHMDNIPNYQLLDNALNMFGVRNNIPYNFK